MRKIEVIHLDAWISRFLQQQDYGNTIKYGDEITELWESASRATGDDMDYPDGFFEEEWISIVQAQGITTLQEYAQAPRTGRGVRLDRKKRIAVWKVFEEYRTMMNIKKVRDSASAMSECCQLLKSQPDYHPYVSIVVDEGQDFGMGAFRLLRALAGDEHENDLFIVGDARQRIYRNKVTLLWGVDRTQRDDVMFILIASSKPLVRLSSRRWHSDYMLLRNCILLLRHRVIA